MKKILLLVAVTCLCFMVNSGFAAMAVNDLGVVGTIDAGTQNADVDNVTDWGNYLLNLGIGSTVTADGNDPLDGVSENYQTNGVTDYSGTLTGGLRIDGATPGDLSGYEWAIGKYDGQNAGYVMFNIADFGGTIPEFSDIIWTNSEGEGYQLSNVTVYGGQVPVPSAFFLLASGLLGLVGVCRKKTA